MSGTDIALALLQMITLLIFARVIVSWIPMFTQRPLDLRNPLVRLLFEVTEPILAPVRRFTMVGMIDLSPLVVLITLSFISAALAQSG